MCPKRPNTAQAFVKMYPSKKENGTIIRPMRKGFIPVTVKSK